MFRVSASRLRSWWSATTDDILGGDLTDDHSAIEYHLAHPHRASVSLERPRRGGTVPARPAHCISPLRGRPARASELAR